MTMRLKTSIALASFAALTLAFEPAGAQPEPPTEPAPKPAAPSGDEKAESGGEAEGPSGAAPPDSGSPAPTASQPAPSAPAEHGPPEPAPATPPSAAAASEPPAARTPFRPAAVRASFTTKSEGERKRRRPRHRSHSRRGNAHRRVVVFTDGPSPKIVSSGDRLVQGALELEVRFKNANPLCYSYSTNIAASRVAASDQALPARAPGIGAFGSIAPRSFSGVDEAFSEVTSAQNDLDEMQHVARFQVSLDDVWASCDAGGDFAVQRERVLKAAETAAKKLGETGSWRETLERAESVALGAKRLARRYESDMAEAQRQLEARQRAVEDAEKAEAQVRERAERTGRTKRAEAELGQAARDLAGAQRRLREAELRLAEHQRAADLARASERLDEQVLRAAEALSAMVADLNRARALLAQSPTAIRRSFAAGETVSVIVERTRLERGEKVDGRPPQLFQVPSFETLRPILFDLGIGPALSLGANTAKYKTVFTPKDANEPEPTYRVVRTEQGIDLDAMVSISVYLWKRRYLDERLFDPWQLIPRPMVGISLSRPLDAIYAGLQIDPIQFIDIGAGVRFANTQKLVGPQPTDRALVDAAGEPQPPVTRKQVKATGFVSLTVSGNMFYRWIKQGL